MTLRTRIVQIDVPLADLDRACAFWSAALSAEVVAAPGPFVHLAGATSALEVHVQALGSGAPRYHLDLEADDRGRETARLVALGARLVADHDDGYTVLADPAGLELCVVDPTAAQVTPVAARRGSRGFLDAVFVDVPEAVVGDSVAFWSSALGLKVAPQEGGYTPLAGAVGAAGTPFGLTVQIVDDPARLHVDLSTPDVAGEVARLQELGASRVGAHDDWVVLADPVGNLLCVVPETGDRS